MMHRHWQMTTTTTCVKHAIHSNQFMTNQRNFPERLSEKPEDGFTLTDYDNIFEADVLNRRRAFSEI